MKFLLTGGTGFLGSRVCGLLLKKGHTVANIGRRNIETPGVINYIYGTKSIFSIVNDFNPDYVVHMAAAYSSDSIENLIEINISLPLQLIECIRPESTKFLTVGSYWELGDASKPGVPIDAYASSKASLIPYMNYYSFYAKKLCGEVILYGTFGDGDRRNKLLDFMLNKAIKGECINLTQGYQKLNLLDVNIVSSKIYELLINNDFYEFKRYSVFSAEEVTPRDIICKIENYIDVVANFGVIDYRVNELMKPIYLSEDICVYGSGLERYIKCFIEKNI